MPQTLTKESAFWAISQQRLGYQFGDPKRVEPDSLSAVVPILRHSVTPRIYSTFPEVKKLKFTDSGRIDAMRAKNGADIAVFIRSGTILKGSTQERTTLNSVILMPGEQLDVKVRCIHASRGIHTGAKVDYGGTVPLNMERCSYTAGFKAMDQRAYWRGASAAVLDFAGDDAPRSRAHPDPQWPRVGVQDAFETSLGAGLASLGIHKPDDLASHYDQYTKSIDELISKVEMAEDQVGLALITADGCETVEVFDAHDSWRALHEDAVKRFGHNLAQKDTAGVFDYKPEKAVEAIQKVLGLPYKENVIYEHKPTNGDPPVTVIGLTAEGYLGEVVELDGKMIHLMLLKAKPAMA